MSHPTGSPPGQAADRADPVFWRRWGLACLLLGALAVYAAYLEGGPSALDSEPGQEVAPVDTDTAVEANTPDEADTPEAADGAPEALDQGFAPRRFRGAGSTRLPLPLPKVTPVLVQLTHDGPGAFRVRAHDGYGTSDPVVDTTGPYEGTRLADLDGTSAGLRQLEVVADGDWTIEVRALSDARDAPQGRISGTGDDVVSIEAGGYGSVTHTGDARFVVEALGSSEPPGGSVLVEVIGPYDGDLEVPGDAEALAVTADGAWEVALD